MGEAARKFVRAYDNLANFDMHTNGELAVLRAVLGVASGAIVDVGANEGEFAKAAIDLTSDGSRCLHCFEPLPDTFQKLAASVVNVPGVWLHNVGLGPTSRTQQLFFRVENSLMSGAFDFSDGPSVQQACRIVRGDDYLAEQHVSEVAYLKIDVEGMEFNVLTGLSGMIGGGRIHAVQFEHGPTHVMSRHFLRDFVEWFAGRNFDVYHCYPWGLETMRYNPAFDENFIGRVFVAVRTPLAQALRTKIRVV